jgi:hypothetical protein
MRLHEDKSDPLTAESRLALVRAKVERAKNNLLDMEEGLVAFYSELRVSNDDPHPEKEFTLDLRIDDKTVSITFDALTAAGDVVNNLWGALDHLIYQLIGAYSPDAGVDILNQSGFPFGKNRSAYEKAKCRRKIQLIDPLAIDLLDDLKPYSGGNSALATLYELNVVSKHQLIITVGKEVMCYAEWIEEMAYFPWFQYKVSDPHFVGVFAPKVDQGAHLASEKTPVEPEIAWGNAMLPTLHQLVDFVDRLIPKFLPFLSPHNSPNPSVID